MGEHLTIGSLFSGVGGLELGLEWAGLGPVLWQVEQNAFCRSVLAKHWPNARRYIDVRDCEAREETLLGTSYRSEGHKLAPVDVVCGGFPCQDISVAGAGAGLEGMRSGLWFDYLRIVSAVRPRFVAIENVSALVNRGLGTVLEGLTEIGV
jgi:DNA (cytosine-5)-methyltransferase 1